MRQRTNAISKISEAHLSDDRVETAVRAASEKKATQIVILDLQEIASFTDYFVICSGKSNRQVQAITDEITERLSKAGARASHVEGYQTAEWVLIDYGDFIVHVFAENARQFYDLERLWRDANRIEIRED